MAGGSEHQTHTRLLTFLFAFVTEWAARLSLFLDSLLYDLFSVFGGAASTVKASAEDPEVKAHTTEEAIPPQSSSTPQNVNDAKSVEAASAAKAAAGNATAANTPRNDTVQGVAQEEQENDEEADEAEEALDAADEIENSMKVLVDNLIPKVSELINLATEEEEKEDVERINAAFVDQTWFDTHSKDIAQHTRFVLNAPESFAAQKKELVETLEEFVFPQLLGLLYFYRQNLLTDKELKKNKKHKRIDAKDSKGYQDLYPSEKFINFLEQLFSSQRPTYQCEFLKKLCEVFELSKQLQALNVNKGKRQDFYNALYKFEEKVKELVRDIFNNNNAVKELKEFDFYSKLIPYSEKAKDAAKGDKHKLFEGTLNKFLSAPFAFKVSADKAKADAEDTAPEFSRKGSKSTNSKSNGSPFSSGSRSGSFLGRRSQGVVTVSPPLSSAPATEKSQSYT